MKRSNWNRKIRAVSKLAAAVKDWAQRVWAGTEQQYVGQRVMIGMEGLEGRAMMSSVAVSNGVLNMIGDTSTKNVMTTTWSSDGKTLTGKVNGKSLAVASSTVTSINIVGGNAGDSIKMDPRMYKTVKITGGTGADTITGGASSDTINAGAGNDSIDAGGGDDSVTAGAGNDTIFGNWGNDKIDGGDGNDNIDGGDGTDTLVTSAGTDTTKNFATTVAGTSSSSTPPSSTTTTPTSTSSGSTSTSGTTSGGSTSTGTPATVLGSASIGSNDSTLVAGETYFASALGTTLSSGTALTARYAWDFGDSGSAYNQLVGFNAAHAYTKAGTYTVTLTVTDEAGKVLQSKTNVTVNADSRKTIYVSSAGSDSNDGSSDAKAVKTAGRAAQLVGNNTRILFRRGDTFSLTTGFYVGSSNVEVSAYGTGNVPVLKRTSNSMSELIKLGTTATDVVIDNIGFDTDTPTNLDKTGAATGVAAQGTRISIRNCMFYGVADAVNANMQPHGLLVQDNQSPYYNSLRGYFVWLQGSDAVIIGNKTANSTREHIVRVGGADRVLIAYNDFTNLDRRGQGDSNDIAKGGVTIQKGTYIYETQNTLNYGGSGVGPLGGPDGKDDPNGRSQWVVLDGNVVNGVDLVVAAGSEHVYLRNNVIKRDNNDGIWLRPLDSYLVNGSNIYAGRNIYDLTIANNTMISNGTTGNFLLIDNRGAAGQVTFVNNLLVAPNMTAGAQKTAAVYINDDQANGAKVFKKVEGNVWNPLKLYSYAQGGYFYVLNYWSDSVGYLTMSEWDSMVANLDRSGVISLDSSYKPGLSSAAANGSKGQAGVQTDLYGKARAGIGGGVTAGAVQL